METVTLSAAKEDLERLVARAAAGEEIVIQSEGRAVARIVPGPEAAGAPRRRRIFEQLAGQVVMHPNFDDPLPGDMQAAFEGRGRLWPDEL